MGIDLKLLASNFRERRGELLSTASVRLDRDPRLFALFSKDATPPVVEPLPKGLKIGHYEDEGLRFDDKDRYRNDLTFTTPILLRGLTEKLKKAGMEIAEISEWNRAALAYVFALPNETKVVLYWC